MSKQEKQLTDDFSDGFPEKITEADVEPVRESDFGPQEREAYWTAHNRQQRLLKELQRRKDRKAKADLLKAREEHRRKMMSELEARRSPMVKPAVPSEAKAEAETGEVKRK